MFGCYQFVFYFSSPSKVSTAGLVVQGQTGVKRWDIKKFDLGKTTNE